MARRQVGVAARMRWLPVLSVFIIAVLAVPVYRAVTEDRGTDEPGDQAPATVSDDPERTSEPSGEITRSDLRALGAIVADPEDGSHGDGWVDQRLGPVYVALRREGSVTGSDWAEGGDVATNLAEAVREARRLEGDTEGDVAEVCISHSYREVDPSGGALTPIHAGVLGVEVVGADADARYSPTLMLANNWDAEDALERYARAHDIEVQELGATVGRIRVFECEQFLIDLSSPEPTATEMFRGNEVVELDAVSPAGVSDLADGMGQWMLRSLHPDGRMTYKYWPSARRESDANNMIRQWMASVALTRWGHFTEDQRVLDLAAQNIRFNLDRFYEERDGLGLILYDDKVKLGSVALAALAIAEHPERGEFEREEAALRRTVDHLWNDDGSFDTFLLPEGRNDNQNFYPGEALVLWAHLLAEEEDPALAERFTRSFRYYRDWHLDEANRNPAFVPWHTQAYFERWRQTRDPELMGSIFEMNDWLLDMQQWDHALYPDVRGRFYDPERPRFGVPHASSTGVYLEGLADAHALAAEVGEDERAERYGQAIVRGLRSVMQLQFADEIDLYYVTEQDRARGGIRTTVYDNEIRVDNVQHNLMAVMKLLSRPSVLSAGR